MSVLGGGVLGVRSMERVDCLALEIILGGNSIYSLFCLGVSSQGELMIHFSCNHI